MSDAHDPTSHRGSTMTDEPEQEPHDHDEDAAAEEGVSPKPTAQKQARRLQAAGLWLAPVFIAVLAFLLYLYMQSLDLENAPRQQRSALDWSGKLQPQLIEQLEIAFWSTVIVIAVAIPVGIMLTRPALRKIGPAVLTVANSGQALPAYGLLVIFLVIMGQGQVTVIWALALYALLPVLRNTMVGLDGVDRSVIEAGRGMGLTKWQALTKIEMPLAVPVIIAGVRTAVILNIGMATLAFLIGGGGLGITINSGLKLNQNEVLIVGAWLVALVALTFDWFGALAEKYLRPRGI
jgi:osmoprotectant transport system permease protein